MCIHVEFREWWRQSTFFLSAQSPFYGTDYPKCSLWNIKFLYCLCHSNQTCISVALNYVCNVNNTTHSWFFSLVRVTAVHVDEFCKDMRKGNSMTCKWYSMPIQKSQSRQLAEKGGFITVAKWIIPDMWHLSLPLKSAISWYYRCF